MKRSLGVFFVLAACAASDPSTGTSAISSAHVARLSVGTCGSDGLPADPVTRSSGLMFTDQSRVFVVTSEAFAFENEAKPCIAVERAGGKWSATRVAVDWGRGLALVEAVGASAAGLPTKSALAGEAIPDAAKLLVAGYPLKSDALRTDENGVWLTGDSLRHGIALLDRVGEVQGAFVDSGMVGGGIWRKEGGFVGMLAHQYLKIVPGGKSRVLDWDGKAGHWERHLVAIRAGELFAWLEKALGGDPIGALSPLTRNPKDPSKVGAGGVDFALDCPEGSGGGDGGGPVGGADGVGVGGDGSGTAFCKVKLSESVSTVAWPLEEQRPWITSMKEALKQGSVETVFFIQRTARLMERVPLYTLGDFVKKLRLPLLTPVTIVPAEAHPPSEIRERLLLKGKDVSEGGKTFAKWLDSSWVGELLRETYFLLRTLESDEWSKLSAGDWHQLADKEGRFKQSWGLAFQFQPQIAQAFQNRILAIAKETP